MSAVNCGVSVADSESMPNIFAIWSALPPITSACGGSQVDSGREQSFDDA